MEDAKLLTAGSVTPPRAHSRLAIALQLVNTVLLTATLVGGFIMYRELRHDVEAMQQPHYWMDKLLPRNANGAWVVPPSVTTAMTSGMAAAVGDWFLGSVNGTVAGFIESTATTDFGAIGAAVQRLSTKLLAALMRSASSPSCKTYSYTCPQGGVYMWCPEGGSVYCSYEGQQVTCGNSCLASQMFEPVALVQSIASVVAGLPPVTESNSTDGGASAAFSSGIFALTPILSRWIRAQMEVEPWIRAADACTALADNVLAADWSGVYKDWSGSGEDWDANSNVQSIAKDVRRICASVANMTDGSF